MAVLIESLTKSANKERIAIGEVVTFSFVFETTQSATVECFFLDNLDPCLEFVRHSMTFDGVSMPDADPTTGFTFTETMHATHTMSFQAKAVCRPDDGIVANIATVSYEHAGVPDTITSNIVQVAISSEATCDAVGHKMVDISIPVSVTPFARVGTITTRCCGEPTITPGINVPSGPSTNCDFTISQRICVEVPVEFGATVTPGEEHVECTGEGCENCTTPVLP